MNENQKVVYVIGHGTIETVLDKNNKCIYSGFDYSGSTSIMTLKEAVKLIDEDNKKTYSSPWLLISKQRFFEMLEVLPPKKWDNVEDVEMFALSEFMTSSYTSHYAEYKGKYYTAVRDYFTKRIDLVNELKHQIKINTITTDVIEIFN